MSRRWLLALFALAIGGCTCPPAEARLKGFAPAKEYQDAIKQCEAYGDCAPLCVNLFLLDTAQAVVEHCTITHVDDLGASVTGLVEYDNVCAVDEGDFVIGADGTWVDDGGDDGTVDDGSGDGTTTDGSGSDGSDDGTVDDGGGDDGSTGDDGGDDGGGDDGGDDGLAPHHHQLNPVTGSRA